MKISTQTRRMVASGGLRRKAWAKPLPATL
jgi:hypothetical protein